MLEEIIIDLAVFVIIIVEPFFCLLLSRLPSKLVIEWPEQNKLEANSKILARTTIGITNTTWFKITGFIRVIY